MLSNLFETSRSKNVYISVTHSAGLEIIELDKHGDIVAYAQSPLEYDENKREIEDLSIFKTLVEEITKTRNISLSKANVYLNLPTVWFGYKDGLPLLIDDDGITNVALTELEQSYIFKRKEAIPVWFDATASSQSDSRSIFYTAIQADVLDELKTVFSSFGATLVNVECSLSTTLRGLYTTGICSELMNNETSSWSLMVITSSGYKMFDMAGKKPLDYFEEPIPFKSFDGEDVYIELENSVQIAMMDLHSTAVVIVSETDLISAELFTSRLNLDVPVITVENNQFKKEPLMEMSLNVFSEDQIKVSLDIIGLTTPSEILPFEINFIKDNVKHIVDETLEIPLGEKSIILTPKTASIAVAGLSILLLLPIFGTYFAFQTMTKSLESQIGEINSEISSVDKELAQYEGKSETSFNPVAEIEKILKNNRQKIMVYSALGDTIPKDLYITYFMTGGSGMIEIRGCANSVEDVYAFFKNLRDALADSNLRLSKLSLPSESTEDLINGISSLSGSNQYVFEITNMNEGQLSSFMNSLTGTNNGSSKENTNAASTQATPAEGVPEKKSSDSKEANKLNNLLQNGSSK